MRILRFPDVNTEAASSTASTDEGAASTVDNNNSDSSGVENGNQEVKTDDKSEPTLNDAVQQHLDQVDKDNGSSTEADDADKSRSVTEQDQKEEGNEGEEEEEGKEQDKGPIPYERFQEVVKERDTFKQTVEAYKQRADNYDSIASFCQSNQITGEQFKTALRIQGLLNTDPAKALEELQPVIDALKSFKGEVLPQDLQSAVDEGQLSLQFAKEIASMRAQSQFGQQKVEHDRKQWEARQQAEQTKQMVDSVKAWETSKKSSDPDFKPKASATADDGKWEEVRDKVIAWSNATTTDAQGNVVYANPIRNGADLVALHEKAYQFVNKRYSANGKQTTKKVLPSNGSSRQSTVNVKSIEEAPTLQDAVKFALDGRK